MEEHKDRLIETLIRGRDSAQRLQNVLVDKLNVDGSDLVEDLLMEVVGSFTGGLSMLNSSDSGEISRVPASPLVGLASPVDRIVTEGRAGKKPPTVVKQRRGCYKRRRTIDSREIISTTMEDGYHWRKYGQKEILNSKFPRCYFRCTHKYFHGCKAVKQVQKLEDESNTFHITYFGHHTCPNPNNTPHNHMVLDFEDTKSHNLFSNSPSTITNIHINDPSVKQEVDSKAQSTEVSDIISSGNDDHLAQSLDWYEALRADLGPCVHEGASFRGFDPEDSCASTSSHGYLNMEFFNSGDMISDILLMGEFSRR